MRYRSVFSYGHNWGQSKAPADADYIKELKSVATAFGYSPEDVDALIAEGISPEEIEEYFYCGMDQASCNIR